MEPRTSIVWDSLRTAEGSAIDCKGLSVVLMITCSYNDYTVLVYRRHEYVDAIVPIGAFCIEDSHSLNEVKEELDRINKTIGWREYLGSF